MVTKNHLRKLKSTNSCLYVELKGYKVTIFSYLTYLIMNIIANTDVYI